MRTGIAKTLVAGLLAGLLAASVASGFGRHGSHHEQPAWDWGKSLTYAEVHSVKNDQQVVTRIDRGTVKSKTPDSITITENDGSDVTIPVDAGTRYLVFGDKRATLSDVAIGDTVLVKRLQGQPAKLVLALGAKRHWSKYRHTHHH